MLTPAGGYARDNSMPKSAMFQIAVVCIVVALAVQGCGGRGQEDGLLDAADLPPQDPAQVIAGILAGMGSGNIDQEVIIYGGKQQPLEVVHGREQRFHAVRFPVTEVRLSRYDPKTGRVRYSCVVPHPVVAYWQWVPVDPGDLTTVPDGIRMQGELELVQEKGVWKIRVDNDTNPIALYNDVVHSANRTWFTMGRSPASQELVRFNVGMLLASYAVALAVPESEIRGFMNEMAAGFAEAVPKR